MAKGNLFLGYARGKIGDVVMYRANNQQQSRARNRAPKNPRSAKQSVQRMVLATAAKMASAYEPIVNHSWEGVQVGATSVRHFRSLAMKALRNAAAYILNEVGSDITYADFAIKGAPVVGAVDGLPISRGSLSFIDYTLNGDANPVASFTPAEGNITTQQAYEAELAKLGLMPGDQLTIIEQFQNINIPVATFETENNYAQAVRYARVTFVAQLPEGFSGQLVDGTSFNSSLIESAEGTMTLAYESGDLTIAIPAGNLGSVQCACLIRSQKQPNGSFKYSSANMKAIADTFDFNNAAQVYPSYMDGATAIEVGDTLYLRNAVAAPFA